MYLLDVRLGLVDEHLANGTILLDAQVLHNAAVANCVTAEWNRNKTHTGALIRIAIKAKPNDRPTVNRLECHTIANGSGRKHNIMTTSGGSRMSFSKHTNFHAYTHKRYITGSPLHGSEQPPLFGPPLLLTPPR